MIDGLLVRLFFVLLGAVGGEVLWRLIDELVVDPRQKAIAMMSIVLALPAVLMRLWWKERPWRNKSR